MFEHIIEKERASLISICKRLVSIPSVNPPGEHDAEMVAVLEEIMKDSGFRTRRVRVPSAYVKKLFPNSALPRINLLAEWGNNSGPHLHLNGHFDVVPAGTGWKTPPFYPQLRGSRLYGRGAGDMKGALAMSICAVRALQKGGFEPKGKLSFSFVCDEESGSKLGSAYLLKKGLIKPSMAIITEPTAPHEIAIGHKGALWLDVAIKGKAAHGARPHLGKNAFLAGMRIAHRIEEYAKELSRKGTPYAVRRGDARHPTLMLGGIAEAKGKVNIVPDNFHFSVDARLAPGIAHDDVKRRIAAMAEQTARRAHVRAHTTEQFRCDAAINSTDTPLYCALSESIRTIVRRKPFPFIKSAVIDMHYFTARGIPCLNYGATAANIHGTDEYVKLPELMLSTKVIASTIAKLLS